MALSTRLQRTFCNQMAAWCMLFRRRDMAMTWYRRMLALDPRDTLALASLGFQHAHAGENRDALALYRHEHDHDHAAPHDHDHDHDHDHHGHSHHA